ncbi:Fungal-trans domain-containing protein [Fusarium falciforme]|uniref:Fungal-trans domain-containing protein n=1 Tax=Fusarium falciforme TaxID=195108 RepID=UPI002300C35D|nr:Fungal-trans domain-containing protein [Fusarium falciforme]WAO91540.1 Fungal-trans domain-containing protein [Fusarium falciforme]
MEGSRRVVIAQGGPSLAITPNEDPEVLGDNSPSREDLAEDDDLDCDSLTDTGDPRSSDNWISNKNRPNQGSAGTSSDDEAESPDDDETETIQDLPPLTEYIQEEECPPLAQIITSKLGEFARNVGEGSQWMRAHEDQGPYRSRVFAKLPTRLLLASLVEPILEELQQHGIIITRESFLQRLDQQYLAGTDSCADDPSRWTIVNSLFATAMLHRTTNESLAHTSRTAWSYFKNAFSNFPELITRGRDVSACEALLAMTAFMQCTADTQITLQLASATSRLVQTLGLHRRDFYSSLDVPTAQRHQRVFWATYVLEVEMMDKYGCGSGLTRGETPLELPLRCSSSSCAALQACKCSSLLPWRSELAIIQRRIHDQFDPERPVYLGSDELTRVVSSMNGQLLAWKGGLPGDMLTETHHLGPNFNIAMALLLYSFHNSVSRLHMVLVHPRAADEPNWASRAPQTEPRARKGRDACTASARAVINIARNLASEPFYQQWGTLCYPLSAVFVLLLAVLEDPGSVTAQDDVDRIGDFVNLLERLGGDGCDVNRLLGGCRKLHDIASFARSAVQEADHQQDAETIVRRGVMLARLEVRAGHPPEALRC